MSNQTNKVQHSEYAPKRARQIDDGPDDEPGPNIAEDGQAYPVDLPLPAYLRRPLDPEPRSRRWVSGLVVASGIFTGLVVGAAMVVAVTDTPKWIGALGVGKNLMDSMLRRSESAPPVGHAARQPAPRIVAAGGTTATTRAAALEPAPAVEGVTDSEIQLGISAPFSGPAKELGSQMKLGIETAFAVANDAGGIDGRQVKLIAADDGYEPSRTAVTMRQLY